MSGAGPDCAGGPDIRFTLLGPLRIIPAGSAGVAVAQPKHRVVLATLLLRAGQDVPTEEIIRCLWGPAPPATGRKTLQGYVARLRKVLGPDLLASALGGYRLRIGPRQVDVGELAELTAAAEREPRIERRAELLRAALELFRGTPLQDVPSEHLHRHDGTALVERQLSLLEQWSDAELAASGAALVLPRLRTALVEHPFRESLWCRLVLADLAAGRPAEAVAAYHEARGVLAEQLGVDPGPQLRAAYEQALRQPRPATPQRAARRVADSPRVRAEREALGLLRPGAGAHRAVLLHGPPGVGKTTVAARLAVATAAGYPDGRVRAGLSGPRGPRKLDDVLAELLTGLGRPVPAPGAVRLTAYQRAVTQDRVLVVLDDVETPEQAHPLLPAGGLSAAVLTGPRVLAGLRHVRLDPFSPGEGRAALLRLAGERWTGPVDTVDELVALAEHLPLAVQAVATRLLTQQRLEPVALRDELTDPARRLDALRAGSVDVRAALVRGYRRLSPGARRALRLVSLLQAPSFPPHVAAAALGLPLADTQALLDEVTAHHLLVLRPDDRHGHRYQHRELVRLCARELAGDSEPAAERRQAVERALSAWYRTARTGPDTLTRSGHSAGPRISRWPDRAAAHPSSRTHHEESA